MSTARDNLRGLARTYLRRRYTILFYTLLLTLLAVPVISALKMSGTLLESLLAASLLAAILPVSVVRSRPYLLLTMVLVWLARTLTDWLDHPALAAMTLGIWTLIGLLAGAAALRFAMRADQVDAERLYSALSAYLLAGIYFGLLYWVLEQLNPDTFTVTGPFSQASAIYFSFVTLATLGYGDIAPRGDMAGALPSSKVLVVSFSWQFWSPASSACIRRPGSIKLIILSWRNHLTHLKLTHPGRSSAGKKRVCVFCARRWLRAGWLVPHSLGSGKARLFDTSERVATEEPLTFAKAQEWATYARMAF